MNTQLHATAGVRRTPITSDNIRGTACCNKTETADVLLARLRLHIAKKKKKKKSQPREAYYGDGWPNPEDILTTLKGGLVTRNHYGCLVLNATSTLFLDVDLGEVENLAGTSDDPWRTTLDDLRTVLSHEQGEGFRIYRTAAGFRILATAHEFNPHSAAAARLMNAVGADDDFVKLCRIQRNFRARLTPKPWRCGFRRPPNSFPRRSADELSQFSHWLTHYERACQTRATCRFLEHVGPHGMHADIAPIVQLHDRETKALEDLVLA